MSVLALLHGAQIANGEIIDADDLKDNFNQLINLLNGTSNNVEAVMKLTSPTVAPLTLNQLNAAGPVQIWQLNSVDKIKINAAAQLESLLATGTAPFVVASITKVTNLNADLLDGLSSADFGQVGVSKIPFVLSFKIDDPASFPVNDQSALNFIRIPSIQSGFLTKISIVRAGGSHTPGAGNVVTFRVFLNGAGVGSGVSFNDTNNAAFTFYTEDFADQAIADGSSVTVVISAKTGTITETFVTVNVEGYQTLKL